jgi:hypothetical protein
MLMLIICVFSSAGGGVQNLENQAEVIKLTISFPYIYIYIFCVFHMLIYSVFFSNVISLLLIYGYISIFFAFFTCLSILFLSQM